MGLMFCSCSDSPIWTTLDEAGYGQCLPLCSIDFCFPASSSAVLTCCPVLRLLPPPPSCEFFNKSMAHLMVRAGDCSMWGTDPAPDTPLQTSAPDACFLVGPEDPQQNGQNLSDNLPVFSLLTCSYTKADHCTNHFKGYIIHLMKSREPKQQTQFD